MFQLRHLQHADEIAQAIGRDLSMCEFYSVRCEPLERLDSFCNDACRELDSNWRPMTVLGKIQVLGLLGDLRFPVRTEDRAQVDHLHSRGMKPIT